MHSIVDVEVAEALIDRFRRPRAGGSWLPVTRKKNKVELTVFDQADLAGIINLQEHNLGTVGLGSLRIKCGGSGYMDMIMVAPKFVVGSQRLGVPRVIPCQRGRANLRSTRNVLVHGSGRRWGESHLRKASQSRLWCCRRPRCRWWQLGAWRASRFFIFTPCKFYYM